MEENILTKVKYLRLCRGQLRGTRTSLTVLLSIFALNRESATESFGDSVWERGDGGRMRRYRIRYLSMGISAPLMFDCVVTVTA